MEVISKISHDDRRKFVISLQAIAGENRPDGSTLVERLAYVRSTAFSGKTGDVLALSARSVGGDEGTLRVFEPTESYVSAKISTELSPSSIDFYLTRPAGGGVVETRLLGTVKHPNSDGNWSLRFKTDRFAVNPDDSVLLHAEVIGRDGGLLALGAQGAIS